ncbi:MAG: thioesterase family protein [Lacisediminihabitans sp.]
MTVEAEPYYLARGHGRYESTLRAQGAWNPHEQHMAPVSGILAHSLERFEPRDGMRMARISYEILGLIPDGEFEIVSTMLRPGRTIELVQAELVSGGRTAVRATAWRMQQSDTSEVAAIEDERMPMPDEHAQAAAMSEWPGGYIQSVEIFTMPGHRAGHGRAWIRAKHPLVEGESFTEVVALIGLIDTTNGIATRVKPGPGSYLFPNLDLQLHLYREPAGSWLGLENSVSFGYDGIGLTSTVLHDTAGPFGRAEQILTIRKST